MARRRFFTALVLIGALAFAGRAIYILTVTNELEISFDERYYIGSADRVAAGDGFKAPPLYGAPETEDALHPPLTAMMLLPAAKLRPGSELAMRFTVAFAGVAVVVLAGLLARAVAGDGPGLVAAALAAVYPNLWANDGIIMAETFAALGTTLTLVLAYRLLTHPTVGAAVALGLIGGVTMLARSELGLLLPVVAVLVLLRAGSLDARRRLALLVVVGAAALVPVAPWVAYNFSRFEEPVFLSHGEGSALAGANCEGTYDGPYMGFWVGLCGIVDEPVEPSKDSHFLREQAFEYMGDNAERLPLVFLARIGRAFSVFRPMQMVDFGVLDGIPRWVSTTGLVMYAALVPLAVAGAVHLWRRRAVVGPLLATFVLVAVVAAAFYGRVRFRVPAEVPLVVLASVPLAALAGRRWPELRPRVVEP